MTDTDRYTPPYRITPGILHSIEQIGEALGNLRAVSDSAVVPVLRRGNRIKTIQASLAIEGNSLSLEQVTAVLAGKRILAQPREIQEVRNAFAASTPFASSVPLQTLVGAARTCRTAAVARHRVIRLLFAP